MKASDKSFIQSEHIICSLQAQIILIQVKSTGE